MLALFNLGLQELIILAVLGFGMVVVVVTVITVVTLATRRRPPDDAEDN